MKRLAIIIIGLLLTANCMAATHYVMPTNDLAADPYTNWGTAGTNLIAVVNAAMTNTGTRFVWVTNGTYYLTNQVTVSSALTLQSVNGRDVTIVDGNNFPGKPVTNRCFYFVYDANGSVLDGFTITNGFTKSGDGGGVMGVNITVKNCRITGCVASNANGAGMYSGGVVTNCEIIGNINYTGNGAGIYSRGTIIANCTIASNRCLASAEIHGAGIFVYSAAPLISNCKIYGNTCGSLSYGGGMALEMNCDGTIVRNSLIYGNSAGVGGGICTYQSSATIQNCTVVSNVASDSGGGINGAYIYANTTNRIENTVCYFNTCGHGSNIHQSLSGAYTGSWQIVNSCFAPTNAIDISGIQPCYFANNIEVNPLFAGKDANNWRLTRNSLGVNAGTNQAWMDGAFDLDGRPRRDRFSKIVDMGCYEYLPQGIILSGR